MRDLETIGTAIHAAETGHMVFSTLHTLDAVETINRIIAVFPPPEQKQVRLQLAAILARHHQPAPGEARRHRGPRACVEVMINTAFIRECILVPERTRSVRDAIAAGTSQYGMQTFDQSLWDLFQANLIGYETALENASNADDFKLRMQGIASTADISRQSMQSAGLADGSSEARVLSPPESWARAKRALFLVRPRRPRLGSRAKRSRFLPTHSRNPLVDRTCSAGVLGAFCGKKSFHQPWSWITVDPMPFPRSQKKFYTKANSTSTRWARWRVVCAPWPNSSAYSVSG